MYFLPRSLMHLHRRFYNYAVCPDELNSRVKFCLTHSFGSPSSCTGLVLDSLPTAGSPG